MTELLMPQGMLSVECARLMLVSTMQTIAMSTVIVL